MKSFSRYIYLAVALLLAFVAPAFAITVTAPANGAQVGNPFPLQAAAPSCLNLPLSAMGYSIDYGPTTIVASPFNGLVLTSVGSHTLHVKCWNTSGGGDMVNVGINVTDNTPSFLPNGVFVNAGIQALTSWTGNNDPGTSGSSYGTSKIVNSPSFSGAAREFDMTLSGYGGQIYHDAFGADVLATHFIYDARVMLANPSAVANVELDMNQVTANGQTVIYGFQCDGWSGTWDYTLNTGTATAYNDQWQHSSVKCTNPKNWGSYTWHHVQISYFRDSTGKVTYQTVVFDGVAQDLNVSGFDSFALGWGSVLLTNFQIDSNNSGTVTATAFADNMTIYRW